MAFVQEFGGVESSANSTLLASGTTTAGHLIVVLIELYTGATDSVSSVTDDGGNTYQAMPTGNPIYTASHNGRTEVWYSITTHSNATGVTAHFSASVSACMSVQEHSGSYAIDVSSGTASHSTTLDSGTTAALAGSSDLAVGCAGIGASNETITSTGTGYTATTQRNSTTSSNLTSILSAYKYSATSTGEDYNASVVTTEYGGAGVVCFKPVSAGVLPVNRPKIVSQAVQRASVWCRRADGLLVPRRRIFVPSLVRAA